MTFYDAHEAYKHNDVTRIEYRNDDDRPSMGAGTDDEYRYGYDTEVSKSIVKGELAERIRRAMVPFNEDEPVYIIEETGDASYSDWTQEQYRDFYVQCGESVQTFSGWNGFASMLDWLDKEAPVR